MPNLRLTIFVMSTSSSHLRIKAHARYTNTETPTAINVNMMSCVRLPVPAITPEYVPRAHAHMPITADESNIFKPDPMSGLKLTPAICLVYKIRPAAAPSHDASTLASARPIWPKGPTSTRSYTIFTHETPKASNTGYQVFWLE